MEKLRNILHQPPDVQTFHEVCAHIALRKGDSVDLQEALALAQRSLASWPDNTRLARPEWFADIQSTSEQEARLRWAKANAS